MINAETLSKEKLVALIKMSDDDFEYCDCDGIDCPWLELGCDSNCYECSEMIHNWLLADTREQLKMNITSIDDIVRKLKAIRRK